MLSKQNTSPAINRRMPDPRFNWLDAPRGELKFAALQQNAAARQRLSLIKRAAAVLVPKPVFSWNQPVGEAKEERKEKFKQRRCYCVGAYLEAGRRICFVICTEYRIGEDQSVGSPNYMREYMRHRRAAKHTPPFSR